MRTILFYLCFLFLGLFFSCQQDKNIKVGFLLPNLIDGRYPKDRDYFTAKIKELGGTVEFGDANNDANQQEEQARKMIKEDVKILVIAAVNQNIAASIVRYAHDNGVKVIAYERLIQNCELDYFVTFNHYTVGKQQATYAISKVPKGNYVLIGGDKGDKNAELIKKGQLEIIEPLVKSGQINVLYNVFIENWSPDNAYIEMVKVIDFSREKIDVVLSANDGMAEGIIKALEKGQPDYPVLVTGLDADLSACQRIIKKRQTMTIYKPFKKQAELTAELAIKLIKGETIEKNNITTFNGTANVATISLEPVVVDNSNLMSTIIADGYYKEADLLK